MLSSYDRRCAALTVQILWRYQLKQLLQPLTVLWPTIKTQKHPGVGSLGTSRIGPTRNHLEHALGGHKTGLGHDAVTSDAFEDEHWRLMAQQNGVYVSRHAQRTALGLTLHGHAVDGDEGQPGIGDALRHLHGDVGQVIEPSGVRVKMVRTRPHHSAKAGEQDEGVVLPQLFHRRQHLDAHPLTIAHAVLLVET